LLPLRALNEGWLRDQAEVKTMSGGVVPKEALRRTVEELTCAVLSKENGFSEWRYSNTVGVEQLRGLSGEQLQQWQHPATVKHEGGIVTNEDAQGELGLFWATKIGGPSHGFDYEGHCVLPLLANARHKVIFVNDPEWRHYPAGRAHFRLLWAIRERQPASDNCSGVEPRLWLEALHRDGAAEQHGVGIESHFLSWVFAVLRHALARSDTMHVVLSVHPDMGGALRQLVVDSTSDGCLHNVQEEMILRPSNGVCEASDELSLKHDWVQMTEEVTQPLQRILYVPSACS